MMNTKSINALLIAPVLLFSFLGSAQPSAEWKKWRQTFSDKSWSLARTHAEALLQGAQCRPFEINAGGASCQADALWMREILARPNSDDAVLALLLNHLDPSKVGQRFEVEDFWDNLVALQLIAKRADWSKTKVTRFLRQTRELYMLTLVQHHNEDPALDPKSCIEDIGSRFQIKEAHRQAIYNKVFTAWRKYPVVLAFYEGFPVLEKHPTFTGLQYLFVFDFDANQNKWTLRTTPTDTNIKRQYFDAFPAHHPEHPETIVMTQDRNAPLLMPAFVNEGVCPNEDESALVVHVGGLWRPVTKKPNEAFVSLLGLDTLDLHAFLTESVDAWDKGAESQKVAFTVLHHNLLHRFQNAHFLQQFKNYRDVPPYLYFGGNSVQLTKAPHPCFIRKFTPIAHQFAAGPAPGFEVVMALGDRIFSLVLRAENHDNRWLINYARSYFAREIEGARTPATLEDWQAFTRAIRPYVCTTLSPAARQEFSNLGFHQDNFDFMRDVMGQWLVANHPDHALGEDSLLGDEEVVWPQRESVGLLTALSIETPLPGAPSCLFDALRLSRTDFVQAVVSAFRHTDDENLRELILDSQKHHRVSTMQEWIEVFSQDSTCGGLTEIWLASRLYGWAIHVYEQPDTTLPAHLREVVDATGMPAPEERHILVQENNHFQPRAPALHERPLNELERNSLHQALKSLIQYKSLHPAWVATLPLAVIAVLIDWSVLP